MTRTLYHGGYPVGAVAYTPKSFKRRGAIIRYISAGTVIWLLKPEIEAHYARLDRLGGGSRPQPAQRILR